jgi:alanine dehydrogenase
MTTKGTLLLKRSDITSLLDFDDYFEAVESAFRAYGRGRTLVQGFLHFESPPGEFHVKGGGLKLERTYFGLKNNGGFPQNPRRYGIPTILGTITLCDGENGYPLAILDSCEITKQRTAAASAVAAKYLARPESSVITICGCGNQGNAQLRAALRVLPIKTAFAFDMDPDRSRQFATDMSKQLSIKVLAVDDLAKALPQSDVCITCTPSDRFYVSKKFGGSGHLYCCDGSRQPRQARIGTGAAGIEQGCGGHCRAV